MTNEDVSHNLMRNSKELSNLLEAHFPQCQDEPSRLGGSRAWSKEWFLIYL
jgi:hypothetical protein